MKPIKPGPPIQRAKVNRPIWKGNFNIWWLLGAVLGIWFCNPAVFIVLVGAGPFFFLHLIPSVLANYICVWNIFHSPSHGPTYRFIHVWLGRIALVFVVFSTTFGIVTAYCKFGQLGIATVSEDVNIDTLVIDERFDPEDPFKDVGNTVGGAAGLSAAIGAYIAIRVFRNIKAHIIFVHTVFFLACLIPASQRLPELVGAERPEWWSYVSWLLPALFGALCYNAIRRKKWY